MKVMHLNHINFLFLFLPLDLLLFSYSFSQFFSQTHAYTHRGTHKRQKIRNVTITLKLLWVVGSSGRIKEMKETHSGAKCSKHLDGLSRSSQILLWIETLNILLTELFQSLVWVRLASAARLRWDIPHLSPLRFSEYLSDFLNRSALPHAVKKVAKQTGCLSPCLLLILGKYEPWVRDSVLVVASDSTMAWRRGKALQGRGWQTVLTWECWRWPGWVLSGRNMH